MSYSIFLLRLPIPLYFDFCSFIGSPEISCCNSTMLLVFKIALNIIELCSIQIWKSLHKFLHIVIFSWFLCLFCDSPNFSFIPKHLFLHIPLKYLCLFQHLSYLCVSLCWLFILLRMKNILFSSYFVIIWDKHWRLWMSCFRDYGFCRDSYI